MHSRSTKSCPTGHWLVQSTLCEHLTDFREPHSDVYPHSSGRRRALWAAGPTEYRPPAYSLAEWLQEKRLREVTPIVLIRSTHEPIPPPAATASERHRSSRGSRFCVPKPKGDACRVQPYPLIANDARRPRTPTSRTSNSARSNAWLHPSGDGLCRGPAAEHRASTLPPLKIRSGGADGFRALVHPSLKPSL